MKNSSSNKLNQLLFSGPENSNRNHNFNNINIITQNTSNLLYENNHEKFINTEISYYNNNNNDNEINHNVSFCTKGGNEKPEKLNFSGTSRNNTEVFYDIYNETTSTNHKNLFENYHNNNNNNNNCTDVNIKNKIMNLNASLKSFNIHVKNKLISYADFENSRNKNSYINFLLDYISDLLWIVKADKEAKNELVAKLQSSNFKFEEYERKIKKANNELIETKKYLNNALNKNSNFEKEKNNFAGSEFKNKNFGLAVSSRKFNNNNNNYNNGFNNTNNNAGNGNISLENEFALVKAENKKLNSQLALLKNEIKKRELEFSKIQEKVKKLLDEKIAIKPASSAGLNNSFSNNNINNNFNPIGSINNYNNNNNNLSVKNRNNNNKNNLGQDAFKLSSFIGFDLSNNNLADSCSKKLYSKNFKSESFNQLKNLYKKFLEFNTHNNLIRKYDSLLNQNTILMSVLFNFQESLDRINQKIIYFNRNNTKIKSELLDLIKLKENIFSLHLIDKELLNEFSDNFLENIKLFEDIILRIMEFIYFENSEWKEKYFKLEKELFKAKGIHSANNDNNYALNSNPNVNETYNSKDSDNANNNHYNNPNGNVENNNVKKEKDLVKNLKRWSIKASINGPSISSAVRNNYNNNNKNISQKSSLRNSSFAGRIVNENINNNNNDINNFDEYENVKDRFAISKNRNQSIRSVKFL